MTGLVSSYPEEQTDLFGHEKVEKTLLELWNNKRLAGSWLFCGPKGIGKATLAYRLARFILAQPEKNEISLFGEEEKPVSLDIPNDDSVFKSVAQRTNPGLCVIECTLKEDELKSRQALLDAGKPLDSETEKSRKRYDEIRITDIREAESFLHLTASANGWRVMIIDSADDMNTNAANALLKSLEEPPPKTVIILISHQPGKLLPTIRSRCRKIQLKPLENNDLNRVLKARIEDIPEQELHTLTLLSEGSLGKALSLYEQDGVSVFTQMISLLADFPKLPVTALYAFTEKTLKEKEVMKTAQALLIQWLGRVCVQSQTGEGEEIFLSELSIMKRIQNSVEPLRLMEITEEFQKAFADTDLDQKQVFVNAFLKLQREAVA